MKKFIIGYSTIVLLSTPIFSQESTAEVILTKHINARGGAEKMKGIETLRLRGGQSLSPAPMELPIVIEHQRPNLQRVELTVQGMTRVTTFNGKEGWIKTPWAADKEAQPLKPEETRALAETDFDTPYLDWKSRGWNTEYMGRFNFEGRNVHRVKLTVSNTETIIGSFDANNFQELHREHILRDLGNEIILLSTFDDYRSIDGISFPFFILHRASGRGRQIKLFIDRIEVNPKLPGNRFEKP